MGSRFWDVKVVCGVNKDIVCDIVVKIRPHLSDLRGRDLAVANCPLRRCDLPEPRDARRVFYLRETARVLRGGPLKLSRRLLFALTGARTWP